MATKVSVYLDEQTIERLRRRALSQRGTVRAPSKEIAEPGSGAVESVYRTADAGRVQLVYSLWTLGECLGVLDRLDRQGRLPTGGLARGRLLLLGESARLARLGGLSIVPLRATLG